MWCFQFCEQLCHLIIYFRLGQRWPGRLQWTGRISECPEDIWFEDIWFEERTWTRMCMLAACSSLGRAWFKTDKINSLFPLQGSSTHPRYGELEKLVEQGNATRLSIHVGSNRWNARGQNFHFCISTTMKTSAHSCFQLHHKLSITFQGPKISEKNTTIKL